MDFKEFDKFLEGRIGKIKSVLAAKGDEYNPCGDRLANFKKAALGLDCTPERDNRHGRKAPGIYL